MRKISAGAVITDGSRFLICHATGQKIWDIPKGGIDPGESPIEACMREIAEETSYSLPDNCDITDLGLWPYLPAKDLHLFKIVVNVLPDPATLKCTSMFENKEGIITPEADAFLLIPFDSAAAFLSVNLHRTLMEAGCLTSNS